MSDQAPDDSDITVNIETPRPVREIVGRARAHRVHSEKLNATAAAEVREAARQLHSDGMLVRDVARIQRISTQRASPLLTQAREPNRA